MSTLYVSNQRIAHPFTDRGCRTQEQFEAVTSMLDEVDFACGNPFEVLYEGEEYNSTFLFLYYGHDSELHMVKITPKGRIRRIA